MTPRGVIRVAWTQKLWIVMPIVLFAAGGFLIGRALYNRATVTSSRLLDVTRGAEADALFACTSNDVLERALEATGLDGRILPGRLAEATSVEVAGDNKLLLSVTLDSEDEAERLVQAIAVEAGRAVSVMASEISAADMAEIQKQEESRRQLDRLHKSFQRRLSKIMTEHPFHTGSHGEIMSATRRRLIDAREKLATAKRALAEADAEIVSLSEKLKSRATPGPAAAAKVDSTAAAALRKRIEAIDARLETLRADFTDLHPRVAKVLAERDQVAAELAALKPVPVPAPTAASLDGVRRQLLEKETARAGIASRVKTLEAEEQELVKYVKTEAAAIEEQARRFSTDLRNTADELQATQRKLDAARRAAAENRGSRAAVTMREGEPPPRITRAAGSPAVYAAAGAAIGLVIGALLAALAEVINPILRTTADIRHHLDLPVLAVVPAGSLRSSPAGRRPGTLSTIALALVFLIIATLLLLAVYPGWGEIRRYVKSRAHVEAPNAGEVSK